MEIVLNRRVAQGHLKKFEFVEREPGKPLDEEPGFKEFLRDTSLSGGATGEEIEFLRKLRFKKKRPTPLYYYRALQNLRDPLHFRRGEFESISLSNQITRPVQYGRANMS